MLEHTIQLTSLRADVEAAFERCRQEGGLALLMVVEGDGAVPGELADVLVDLLRDRQMPDLPIALVRDDVIIIFLAASVVIRAGRPGIRAFKTRGEAIQWLAEEEKRRKKR